MIFLVQNSSLKKFLAIGCFLFVLMGNTLAPVTAHAIYANNNATEYTPLAPLPYTVNTSTGKTNMVTYLKGAFVLAIALSGVLAVIQITIGGFQYMVSVSEGGKSEAKARMENSVIGLGLTLGSWLFLNTINPELTKLNFNLPKLADQQQADFITAFQQSVSDRLMTEARTLLDERSQLNADQAALLEARDNGEIGDEEFVTRQQELDAREADLTGKSLKTAALIPIATKADEAKNFTKENATEADLGKAADVATEVKAQAQIKIAQLRAAGYNKEADELKAAVQKLEGDINKAINYRRRCPKNVIITNTGSAGVGGGGGQVTSTPCI